MELKGRIKYCFVLVVLTIVNVECLDFVYHSHEELTDYLKNYLHTRKSFFSRLYSVGKSTNGEDIWVLEIAATNKSEIGTPNVKLVGNIHGNEPTGREVLLHFLEYLATEYENQNSTIKWILEHTRLHVMPSMNPDGFKISGSGICSGDKGRANANFIDLNRNFPDYYKQISLPAQPEILAVQRWMQEIPFILSASLHGGALVANYPYDTIKKVKKTISAPSHSLTPDDDVFVHLAKTYSYNHPTMRKGCPQFGKRFSEGITNGAAWYSFKGSMQDYNYFKHGCMELTLEISCCKYPFPKELPELWLQNKEALIHFIIEANRGVAGQVLDSETKKPIPFAFLEIEGRKMIFNSSVNGEFWRILLPGSYKIRVYAKGYHYNVTSFNVLDNKNKFPIHTFLRIYLTNSSIHIPAKIEMSTELPTIQRTIFENTQENNFQENTVLETQLMPNITVTPPTSQFHKEISPLRKRKTLNSSSNSYNNIFFLIVIGLTTLICPLK